MIERELHIVEKDESVIRKFNDKWGEKYSYVNMLKDNSDRLYATIKCSQHGHHIVSPEFHLNSFSGCLYCDGSYKGSLESFRLKSINKHHNMMDFTDTCYINSRTPVTVRCKKHDIKFVNTPFNILNAESPCPECYREKNYKPYLTKEDLIRKFNEKFGDIYDFSKTIYRGSKNKITVTCKKHGNDITARPGAFYEKIRPTGCPKCKKEKHNKEKYDNFIKLARDKHGETYDYSKVIYKGHSVKVEIICKKHGSFWQSPGNHAIAKLYAGCPKCRRSIGEETIARILENKGIAFEEQKKFDDFYQVTDKASRSTRYDFYLPNLNILIEYDGKQHYVPIKHFEGKCGFERRKLLDHAKDKYAKIKNIQLIRIPYYDYDNISVILDRALLI